MRILVVAPGPAYSVKDVQIGWEKALRKQGHTVGTYNLSERMSFFAAAEWPEFGGLDVHDVVQLATEQIGNVCYKFMPDMIFVISGFFIPESIWSIWRDRRWHKTVLVCTESPYEDDTQFERTLRYEPDVVLLNDPINLMRFKSIHDNVYYSPHAYDPDMHFPGPAREEFACDFSFVGTGYASRRDLFARVDWRGIDFNLAGNWKTVAGTVLEDFVMHPINECFDNVDAADLYRSSKMSANLYRGGNTVTSGIGNIGKKEANHPELNEGWAVGPREIELAACGTFFARESRPEGDELFPMLPIFTDARELTDIMRYYLEHDDKREDAALAARAAIQDRTFDAHAARLMQLLG